MNQTVLQQLPQDSTSNQNNWNVISLEKYLKHLEVQKRIHDGKMLKQRLIGLFLLGIAIILAFLPTCGTGSVITAIFAFPAIFSRTYMLGNKNKHKGDNSYVHRE